jgi:hypothetical protein
MKKLLAVVAGAAALVLVGCGSDTSSCATATAPVTESETPCTLAPGTTVTVQLRPQCQRCQHTSPSCRAEVLGNDIEFDTIYRECAENAGCASDACAFAPIDCVFTTPNASAQYRFVYPIDVTGGLGDTNVTVAPGGSSICRL